MWCFFEGKIWTDWRDELKGRRRKWREERWRLRNHRRRLQEVRKKRNGKKLKSISTSSWGRSSAD